MLAQNAKVITALLMCDIGCVDLQDNAEDWTLGSRGCYDAASLARLQMQLRYDFPSVAAVSTCTK